MTDTSTVSVGSSTTVINGTVYSNQNSGASYAIEQIGSNEIQFQVDAGDVWAPIDPATKNRSEIASTQLIADGTPINVAYDFSLLSGAVSSDPNAWLVVGQFHQNSSDASPPFSVQIINGKMAIVGSYVNTAGVYTTQTLWTDSSNIVEGQTYAMNISVTFSPNGTGNLSVTRDGVTLVAYTGPLGRADETSVYWKEGIYGGVPTSPVVADYSNLTVTTGTASGSGTQSSSVFSSYKDYDSSTGALTAAFVTYKDSSGTATTYWSSGKVKSVIAYAANGSRTATAYYSTGVTQSVIVYGTTGLVATNTQYSTAGLEKSFYKYDANGALSFYEIFGSTGLLAAKTTYNTDGSKIYDRYTVNGSTSYLSQETVVNSSGVTSSLTTYSASGQKILAETFLANGKIQIKRTFGTGATTTTYAYTSAGVLNTATAVAADGSKIVSIYAANGTSVSQQQIYSTSGVETALYQYNANGSLAFYETFGSAGVLSAKTTYNSDGSKVYDSYTINGSASYLSRESTVSSAGIQTKLTTYGSTGQQTLLETFLANGKIQLKETFGTGATSTTYAYTSGGVLNTASAVAADGSKTVTTYAANGTTVSQQQMYSTAGVETALYQYSGNGSLALYETFDSSGLIAAKTTYNADGSKIYDSYTVAGGAPYLSSEVRVNSSGVVTQSMNIVENGSEVIRTYGSNAQMTSQTSIATTGSITETAYTTGITMTASGNGGDVFTSYQSDNFVLQGNFGIETIYGFNAGSGSTHDIIQIDSSLVADFSHLMMSQSGSDTLLTIAPHETITLKGVNSAALTSSDFKFA